MIIITVTYIYKGPFLTGVDSASQIINNVGNNAKYTCAMVLQSGIHNRLTHT